ncbi:hypothetical protein BTO30_12935 [Domibacillus antri]|uniref:DUF2642 domain-containing protein n=1 Tax=Domibacillus antri TaxID=1714264 RepID=A0A1Q8Q333_9BACI|nr:hypothetical protein [Domibacillus antri]OLN21760.1 hypothetical protein BTO30_12935 [Domibacillus antri]
MKRLKEYVGEPIHLDLTGKREVSGILIDFGSDVLVLCKQNEFLYLPLFHVREIRLLSKEEADFLTPPETTDTLPLADKLSLKEVLQTASKGSFVELNMTAGQPVHGSITNVMDDYVVFFSPVYQMMLMPIQHIKWLIPYPASSRPYGFDHSLSLVSSSAPKVYAATFADQIENVKGSFITLNIGEKECISGKFLHKDAHFITLMTVKEQKIHLNINHVKTVALL